MSFKVLIIDDDAELRSVMVGMITRLGYETREASDGIEGQVAALDWQPDIILMDLTMPRQDGLVTCVQLRQHHYKGCILLTSAFSNVISRYGGIEAALACGANGFLAKPISAQEMRKSLNWHLHLIA